MFDASPAYCSLHLLGAAEFEAFVDCCGGTVDKSKTEYVKLLPGVYSIVARFMAAETGSVKVGSFTYDGMSAKLGAAISGMTFNFVDTNWNLRTFPLCFFDTEEIGKTAEEHEAIITAAVRDNDKLGSDVLVISGTCDNEPSVALGVDRYLNFSGAVRCCCHALALAVNDAVRNCNLSQPSFSA